MVFRIGTASNQNYSHAYWFTEPKTPYYLLTNNVNDYTGYWIDNTDKTIWVKKGNKAYKQITLEELKEYIKD